MLHNSLVALLWGVLNRWYWLVLAVAIDPFDFWEFLTGRRWTIPDSLRWIVFVAALFLAVWLTYREVWEQRNQLLDKYERAPSFSLNVASTSYGLKTARADLLGQDWIFDEAVLFTVNLRLTNMTDRGFQLFAWLVVTPENDQDIVLSGNWKEYRRTIWTATTPPRDLEDQYLNSPISIPVQPPTVSGELLFIDFFGNRHEYGDSPTDRAVLRLTDYVSGSTWELSVPDEYTADEIERIRQEAINS